MSRASPQKYLHVQGNVWRQTRCPYFPILLRKQYLSPPQPPDLTKRTQADHGIIHIAIHVHIRSEIYMNSHFPALPSHLFSIFLDQGIVLDAPSIIFFGKRVVPLNRMETPHSPSKETNIGIREAFCKRLVTSACVTGSPLWNKIPPS